jgi:hypothetical protein
LIYKPLKKQEIWFLASKAIAFVCVCFMNFPTCISVNLFAVLFGLSNIADVFGRKFQVLTLRQEGVGDECCPNATADSVRNIDPTEPRPADHPQCHRQP